MEGHTSRSCERGQRRTRERTCCTDETTRAKALWWGRRIRFKGMREAHTAHVARRGVPSDAQRSAGADYTALF